MEGSPTIYPGDQIVRAVRVHPQSVELQYSTEQFTVTETLFTPRQEPGFVVLLEAKTPAALRVFVRFRPDLNLMWPGSIGGQTAVWNGEKKRVELAEPSVNFSAVIGSPAAIGSTAVGYHSYLSDEQPYEQIELHLSAEDAKRLYVPIIVAAGIRNLFDASTTYDHILGHLPELYSESLRHYADLDAKGPEFVTPDAAVNLALRWSRISLDQLRVCNPYLGCGYVSGYGSSGTGTRPMYAWFFEEPAQSSRAFLDAGNVDSMRDAFRFIQKYQRADGAIPHEISQSASLIDWFKNYQFAFIHSDSSLWYLIAMSHFYRFTGDRAFLVENWPSIRKAYIYCLSLLNASDGLLRIPPGGWGSMETAGVATEDSAMAGEWIAALRDMRKMSEAMGDAALAPECETREKLASESLEKLFWNSTLQYYDYGKGPTGPNVTYLNPTIGYSAWFGSLPTERAQAVVERLATAEFLSDWGERSMSLEDPRYDKNSYQVGSAWPFMTAGALLADFRYHHALQGFITWMAMIRLRFYNARGAMPEVLSGAFYRTLDNAVPHQMFSELTAIPGLIDGVLGLDLDVPERVLRLTPHLPPAWPSVSVHRFPFAAGALNIDLQQSSGSVTADIDFSSGPASTLQYSPALPAGAVVVSVLQEGKPIPFKTEEQGSDMHVLVTLVSITKAKIEVRYKGGVSVDVPWQPLREGDFSRNLHVLRTSYQNSRFEMEVEGLPDQKYEVRLLTPWRVLGMGGKAESVHAQGNWKVLQIAAPAASKEKPDNAGYVRWTVTVPFGAN